MAEQEVFDLVVLEGKVFDVIGVNDAKIAQAAEKFMPLSIKDMDDKEGYAAVHEGRMVVKTMRVMVEKHAKKVREKAVKFQKDVIAEEKRVVGLIQPIEDHLADEEGRVEEEKARLRAETAAKEAARVKVLVDKLYFLGCRFNGDVWTFNDVPVATQPQLIGMPEEQFAGVTEAIQNALDEEKATKVAEAERIAQVAADQEKERIRLAEEVKRIKEEQDRIAAEQAKERERLAAEGKAIQDERDRLAKEKKAAEDAIIHEEQAKIRTAELEIAKKEAAEKAVRDAEEKRKLDDLARIEKERKIAAATERKAARAPDKIKILAWIGSFNEQNNAILPLKTDEAQKIYADARGKLEILLQSVKEEAETL